MRDLPAALDQFRPHPVTDVTGPKHAASRAVFERAVTELWAIVPDGPEKTLVMRKLQEASMLSNVAIALSGNTVGEPALERNEAAHRADPIMTLPVVVHIDNRQVLLRPGSWAVPELRQALSVSFGWDLGYMDWHNTRVALHHSETVTVHDGQRFVTTSRKPALPDATQAPAVTEALAQSGVVRVTVDGHGFITAPGEWGVVELREEMGILPDRDLWVAERDGIGRTHLHRNETVVVQAGHAFFTTPEQPPAAARYLPADDAS